MPTKKDKITIVLILLILVGILLSILIYHQAKPKDYNLEIYNDVKVTNCTGVYMDLGLSKYVDISEVDLRFLTYLKLTEYFGTYDIFPLTVELKEPCTRTGKKVYYSYREFPIGNDCYDENNCLWRFE